MYCIGIITIVHTYEYDLIKIILSHLTGIGVNYCLVGRVITMGWRCAHSTYYHEVVRVYSRGWMYAHNIVRRQFFTSSHPCQDQQVGERGGGLTHKRTHKRLITEIQNSIIIIYISILLFIYLSISLFII